MIYDNESIYAGGVRALHVSEIVVIKLNEVFIGSHQSLVHIVTLTHVVTYFRLYKIKIDEVY